MKIPLYYTLKGIHLAVHQHTNKLIVQNILALSVNKRLFMLRDREYPISLYITIKESNLKRFSSISPSKSKRSIISYKFNDYITIDNVQCLEYRYKCLKDVVKDVCGIELVQIKVQNIRAKLEAEIMKLIEEK